MAVDEKWYFTKEQLLQSPSRKSGYDVDKELSCRQQAANFIQDMGQRLQVSQLCINTAIVYMHRFYVFHSLAAFHRNAIAAAALFLAAKVEEQPRKLEHVIKVAHMCLHRENPNLDTKSELYLEQAQDLVFNENVLLQTLGFDVAIDHPHTHVVRCCHLVRASKDLAQTSYFMASNSLHLTTMCLQYKPTVVACFCIHLACRWSNWEIPRSNEGKDWFWYVDKTVTVDLLEQLTAEFLAILDKCPTKLKRKMMSMNQNNTPGFTQQSIPNDGLHFEEPRKLTGAEANKPPEGLFPVQKSNSQSSNDSKPGVSTSSTTSSSTQVAHSHHQKIDYREYREKKERERIEREKLQHQRENHSVSSSNSHHPHSKSSVMSGKNHTNVHSRTSGNSTSHKSYQQPTHGIQQNMHFQNMKDNRDSGYPHKSESNYSGSYPHRDGNRGSHGVPSSGNPNPSQVHHNQNSVTNNINNSRESILNRESVGGKDLDSQSQQKDSMSSSIRDIISQSVPQKDVHSMTKRKEHIRDKSRINFVHGSSSTTNFRPECVKSGREQTGLNFHETVERKADEFSKLKDKSLKKPRPSNLNLGKTEPNMFGLDDSCNSNVNESNKLEALNQSLSLKPIINEEINKNMGNVNTFQKQKGHEFGAPGNLTSSLPDSNFIKNNKTSSIFSPDSKISPQNILTNLEKDSKKFVTSNHKSQSSSKSSPDSGKKHLPLTVLGTITTSITSTTGSLFSPPLPKNVPSVPPRHRTSSSGSEPELIPVLTKLEETPGYENIMREKKTTLTPSKSGSPGADREKKSNDNVFMFDFEPKTKDIKSNDVNTVKSEVSQNVPAKSVVNVKFSNEIRSDLGAVIYPTNPKSAPVTKPNQGFALNESKLSLSNSVSTVNLLGIEKMVDTSISPVKQPNQFGNSALKTIPNPNFSSAAFGSSVLPSADQTEKVINDQKVISNQDLIDVDGYSEKKRAEKKKKKEKHKHKEKEKSEKKKEKKRHKDKDKERLKEKDKHKDKEKHKDKLREKEVDVVSSETPIKITIPKDKISGSLKIKISKDILKKEEEPPKLNTSGELKIKISKDIFSNINSYKDESKSENRKRERSPKASGDLPHPKSMKTSDKKSSSGFKSNGMEGSSRNSSSHKYSVSENDSCFDISSLYDCPFDFEENGEGIIKTPDYDFEALNASEFLEKGNASPEAKKSVNCDNKNSHNESKSTANDVATGQPDSSSQLTGNVSCGDMLNDPILKSSPQKDYSQNLEELDLKRKEIDAKKDKMISFENCDVLKNYKTILDSHSRRCEPKIHNHNVSPVSPEENDDNNNHHHQNETNDTNDKEMKNSDTENPNYYNKYFKKDSRIRREDKWAGKRKYYDRRYRPEFSERDRRDDRRYYRDYQISQYCYERKDDRRFAYVSGLNFDINANGTSAVYPGSTQTKTAPQFPQITEPTVPSNPSEMNVPYQYGYFNNYMYPPNGGYRFYGNIPFVNVPLIQQQPMPPGTGNSVPVQLEPPPLPLEPPPDLPPPPQTPPPLK